MLRSSSVIEDEARGLEIGEAARVGGAHPLSIEAPAR
jgi:hypothetical protein